MNLSKIDWSDARDLLVQLAQALEPLTFRIVAPSFFLNRRFVFPKSYSGGEFPHSVQVLSMLHAVQKGVDELVHPPLTLDKKSEPEDLIRAKPFEKKIEPTKDPIPLTKQARELLQEVQKAIGRLSNSKFIQEPKRESVVQTLKDLKPKLDKIVETVIDLPEPLKEEPPFRPPLPVPVRQHLLQKMKKAAEKEETLLPSKEQPEILSQEEPKKTLPSAAKKERVLERSSEKREEEEVFTPSPVKKKVLAQSIFQTPATEKGERGERPTKADPKPASLPAIPLFLETKRLNPVRKKKKSKNLWSKEEDPSDRDT